MKIDNVTQVQKGFTLVELLVTLAVAVILVTLAAPSFQTMIDNNRRSAQVNEFVADLSYARSEALKRGNNVVLCRASNFNADTPTCGSGSGWQSGWIVYNDADNDNSFNNQDEVLRRHPSLTGNGVTLLGNIDNVVYWPSGRVAVAGTFNRCDHRGATGGYARAIVIAMTGRVNIKNDGVTCP